jgi:hypothetical protein
MESFREKLRELKRSNAPEKDLIKAYRELCNAENAMPTEPRGRRLKQKRVTAGNGEAEAGEQWSGVLKGAWRDMHPHDR